MRNGAKLMEENLPTVSEIIDDATGYILGFPSRRNPNSETDRKELSECRNQLIQVTNSHKPQLEIAQQMRYKVLKFGDLGQEMDAASQRMAKAFMGFLAHIQKFQKVIDKAITEIDDLLGNSN
jgi:hypothetical protein